MSPANQLDTGNNIPSNQALIGLFMQSPIAICTLSVPSLIIEMANEKALELWGRTMEQVANQYIFDCFPELTAQGFRQILEGVYKTGERYISETAPIQLYRNGMLEQVYISFVYEAIKDASGNITHIMGMGTDITPVVQANEKAQESQQQFYNLISQSPVAVAILKGSDMIVTTANDAIIDMWGKGKDVIGLPLLRIMPEIVGQGYSELLNKVYASGQPYHAYEMKVDLNRRGSWDEAYFTFTYQPYREPSGEVTGISIIAYEVTPQALARRKIAQSEGKFRELLLQAPIATTIFAGIDAHIELANSKALDIFGYSLADVAGKPFFKTLPGFKQQGLEDIYGSVYRTGKPYFASEVPISYPHGNMQEHGYFNISYQPVLDDEQKISNIILFLQDVTNQVASRKQIRQTQEHLRIAIETTGLGTFDLNMKTQEMQYSREYCKIFGFDEGYAVTRAESASRIHPDDLEIRKAAHEKSLKTDILSYEARVVHPDHSLHWIRISGKILKDGDGVPDRLLGTVSDITENVTAKEVLEEKVRERTAALNKSNRELEQFAYVASHDLQEPLRKIQMFSSLVEKNIQNPEATLVYLQKIQSSAVRMSALIKDVLNYSKLATFNDIEKATSVDLGEVVAEVSSDLELLIAEKNAVINVGALPTVTGVRTQLNQVLANIISNALKFSTTAPVINIDCLSLSSDAIRRYPSLNKHGSYLAITIKDNGIGFDQQYAEQIFTIFERLNTKQSFDGTGIGLALCRKLVESHGGIIYAESEIGHGATFTIILPQ